MFTIHSIHARLSRFMVLNNATCQVQSSHGWYNICFLERAAELINTKLLNCVLFGMETICWSCCCAGLTLVPG